MNKCGKLVIPLPVAAFCQLVHDLNPFLISVYTQTMRLAMDTSPDELTVCFPDNTWGVVIVAAV